MAEASDFARTSTHADVLAFLRRLEDLPHAARLSQRSFGKTVEGRELPVVRVAKAGADDKALLRFLICGNIHAGEVEGKEAIQILLRELAQGEHADLLEHAVLYFVPIFNADGNDRIDPRNRRNQNGPGGGVGQRENADGLDLNRDFVKLETPEARALVRLMNELDPHLYMDLHTTNGSYHGYHLTYAPSLATNVDPALRDFTRRELLPEIRGAMQRDHGFRIFDYGNFRGRDPASGWVTYDARSRYAVNYFGLRNRIALLSEAYSYVDFRGRVLSTRAFVLETMRACARMAPRIQELCAAADERCRAGKGLAYAYQNRLEDAHEEEVLVGSVTRQPLEGGGVRLIANPEFEARRLPVQLAFVAERSIPLPVAWAISAPSRRVLTALAWHGIEITRLQEPCAVKAEAFVTKDSREAARSYQRHRERELEGAWQARTVTLPKGTAIVRAGQPLARVAAQLLEAQSDDSLATWNFFDEDMQPDGEGRFPDYPVLRVLEAPSSWR